MIAEDKSRVILKVGFTLLICVIVTCSAYIFIKKKSERAAETVTEAVTQRFEWTTVIKKITVKKVEGK